MRESRRKPSRIRAIALWMVFGSSLACAQEPPRDPEEIHWALSSLFGTGWYSIDGNRSVYILNMPMRLTLREAEISDSDGRRAGLEFHLPVTAGYHQVDGLGDFFEPDNFSTLSITPGVEFEIPVTRAFRLRSFVKAGYGVGRSDTGDVWLLNAGIKSRYRIEQNQGNWDFLANLYWGGYQEIGGEDQDSLGGMLLGVERMQWFDRGKHTLNLHASYTKLGRPLEYLESIRSERTLRTLDDFFTVGIAIAPRNGQFDFKFYRPRQLGIALEFDPAGDYFAIKFNSSSWFTR